MTAALKFWISEVEGLYYLYSENKGTDQLQAYSETDLHLCFLYARNQFSCNKAHIRTAYVWDVIRSKREKVISPCSEHTVFLVTRRQAKFMLNYMYLS